MEWMAEMQARIDAMTPRQRRARQKVLGKRLQRQYSNVADFVEVLVLYNSGSTVKAVATDMLRAMASGELPFGVSGPKGEYVEVPPAAVKYQQ